MYNTQYYGYTMETITECYGHYQSPQNVYHCPFMFSDWYSNMYSTPNYIPVTIMPPQIIPSWSYNSILVTAPTALPVHTNTTNYNDMSQNFNNLYNYRYGSEIYYFTEESVTPSIQVLNGDVCCVIDEVCPITVLNNEEQHIMNSISPISDAVNDQGYIIAEFESEQKAESSFGQSEAIEGVIHSPELYELSNELHPLSNTVSGSDPNPIIDEFCKIPSLNENISWLLDMEFSAPNLLKFNSARCQDTPFSHFDFEKSL